MYIYKYISRKQADFELAVFDWARQFSLSLFVVCVSAVACLG